MTPLLTKLHTRIAELTNRCNDCRDFAEGDICFSCGGPDSFDPTLSDVLRAIVAHTDEPITPLQLNRYGELFIGNGEESLASWKIDKNLDDQSNELHRYIASIICGS